MKKILMIALGIFAIGAALIVAARPGSIGGIVASVRAERMLAALCAPGLPCGGQLVTEPVPCLGTGFVWATLRVAGGAVTKYVFEPTAFLHYLPTHAGQYFVGNDLPAVCHCLTSPDSGFSAPCGFFYGTSI